MSTIPQNDNRVAYLYVIRARWTPFIKVGITSDPDARFKRAQTDCPHDLRRVLLIECPRAYDVEQWVHNKLKSRRLRGEWFRVYLDATVYAAVQQAIKLRDRNELPQATTIGARLNGQMPQERQQRYTDQEWLNRLGTERGRDVIIEWMVDHNWTKSQIRSTVRGDNSVIGAEVESARQRLGIAEAPRVIPVVNRGADPRPLVIEPAKFSYDDPELNYKPPSA